MTAVVILGNDIALYDIFDATEEIVNDHINATEARFLWQLEERLAETETVKLKTMTDRVPLSFNGYKAKLKDLNDRYPHWSVRDDRVLFFLDEFAHLAGDTRLLWVDTKKPRTDYEKLLHKRIKKTFAGYDGPKLHIVEENKEAVLEFATGRGKVRKVDERQRD